MDTSNNNKNNTNKKNPGENKNSLQEKTNGNKTKSESLDLTDSKTHNDKKGFENTEINIQILEELKNIRKISKKILKSMKNLNA
ncbi:MAG: hypothetical protein WKF36_10320 [Candidatus Nitrosocosmicus sp.]